MCILHPPRKMPLGIQVFVITAGGLQCTWRQDVHPQNMVVKAKPLAMQNYGFLQFKNQFNQPYYHKSAHI